MVTNVYEVLAFPDEILLKVFGLLDDQTLLKTIQVCKKFKSIAETSVADKYNGKNLQHNHYKIEEFKSNGDNGIKQHKPFLQAFGNKISAINLQFHSDNVNQHHWIIQLVKKHLNSASKVELNRSLNDHFTEAFVLDFHIKLTADIIPCFSKLTSLTLFGVKFSDSSWSRLHCPLLVELNLIYALKPLC